MSDLKTLIKEIKENNKIVNQDLTGTDPRTRPGREMMKTQSKEKLVALKEAHAKALSASAFTVFVAGKKTNELAELAKKNNAIVVDCRDMYEGMAKRCQATMGARKSFGLTQYSALMSELRMWSAENKIEINVPAPILTETHCDSLDDVIAIVKTALEQANGFSLTKNFVQGKTQDAAIELEVDTKVVPVFILNVNNTDQNALMSTLFRGKGLVLNTDEKEVIDEQLLTKTFQQIKALLKG